jgi:2-hydroxy-6-oxonona-2,4-dienedioate hydrolase
MNPESSSVLRSRWDRAGDFTIHARVSATPPRHPGPVLVLVHGLVISSLYMVPTAVRLAPLYPVYAPDLPGFGKSRKPDETLSIAALADALAAWLKALRLARVVLIGNSLGCQIIADFATRHASHLVAAVLAGPTMDRHARSAPRQIGRWLLDWTLERPSLALAHVRDYYEAGLLRALQTLRFALDDPIEEKLHCLAVPTLVVRGARDAIVPQRWTEEVTSRLPDGRLKVIPGAPHVVNYTTPLEFTRIVHGFLQGLKLPGGPPA